MRERIVSLDAFRGITIAFMILVNNPGSWSYVYSPLRHSQWHGCTPTDLVFPFFLFIVGTAMRFSYSKYDYKPSLSLVKKVIWRSVTIFFIGILLNAFPFIPQDWDWSTFRIMGVLHRSRCVAKLYGHIQEGFQDLQTKDIITKGIIKRELIDENEEYFVRLEIINQEKI